MVLCSADPDSNEVALIFDDGPNPKITPSLLDVLRDLNTPANFFLIGARAEQSPAIVKQMVADGHEIGNHTYMHRHLTELLKEKGEQAVRQEVEQGAAAIRSAANAPDLPITFMRPPFLDWNGDVAKIVEPLHGDRIIMKSLVVGDYDWGRDGQWNEHDSAAITKQARRIVDAWSQVASGGTLFAFHDSSEHNLPGNERNDTWMNRALPTLEAVPMLVKYLNREGFVIKKLSDMQLAPELLQP